MEPFKNQISAERVRALSGHLARVCGDFPAEAFVGDATRGLEALELKARSNHIAAALAAHLPERWDQPLVDCLGPVSNPDAPSSGDTDADGVRGWMVMPMCQAVVLRGRDTPERSLEALHALTQRFSAELAIRPFLLDHPLATLATLERWTRDESAHVRRLVSEGSRPRLPWGVRLTPFVEDPSPTVPLLEALKDDPSDYVRKSVANHLNDISKDHPTLAVELGQRWWSEDARRQRLVRHGLRTRIKAGDPAALALLGFGQPEVEAALEVTPAQVAPGESVALTLTLRSTASSEQALLIDYAVHLVRQNGRSSPKVFKWTQRTLAPGETQVITKRHSMRVVTTRRYYPGVHPVQVQVNGQVVAEGRFTLL